ncbi:MAG: helix-turn-helix transcriptional regulator [Bacteriovoracaceae bacterium]|nr:helix-turn-helix transcriptional regulator [Bacteriovoracaceae bacterium]
MPDLHTILADHRSGRKENVSDANRDEDVFRASMSEIPNIFFDQILKRFKLSRIEIVVLMFLYRQVWCRPNLYKIYGISQLLSHTEMARVLGLSLEEVHHALRQLEDYRFMETVRSGQYFVRKYFLKEYDEHYCQTYDDFDI